MKADNRPFSINMDDDPIRFKMKTVYNTLLELGYKSPKISIALQQLRHTESQSADEIIQIVVDQLSSQQQQQQQKRQQQQNAYYRHSRQYDLLPNSNDLNDQQIEMQCQICLLLYTQNNLVTVSPDPGCRHKFCMECLRNYLHNQVEQLAIGNVTKIYCPMDGCRKVFADELIR